MNVLAAALNEFYERSMADPKKVYDYIEKNHLDVDSAQHAIASFDIQSLRFFDNNRFDWADGCNGTDCFIVEAFDGYGDLSLDLVAWPLDAPDQVYTALGQCGLLGEFFARGGQPYILNGKLQLFRTPFEMLQSGSQGACVVAPSRAGRILNELPGPVEAWDTNHARFIQRLMDDARPDRKRVDYPRRGAA